MGVDVEQLSVVVKHLFKVRCTPLSILGVTKKAATQMIKKTTAGHLCQRGHHHFQPVFVRGLGASAVGPVFEQPLDAAGHSKFHTLPKTAFCRIESLGQTLATNINQGRIGHLGIQNGRRQLLQRIGQFLTLPGQLFALLFVGFVQTHQQVREAGLAVLGVCREVGAGEKR